MSLQVLHHITLKKLYKIPKILKGKGDTPSWVCSPTFIHNYCSTKQYHVNITARYCIKGKGPFLV